MWGQAAAEPTALTSALMRQRHAIGGIEAFIRREVLPHAPDAWIDESKTTIGYEIRFTRYFYKPLPLRPLDAIRADIVALEREMDGLMAQIIGASR